MLSINDLSILLISLLALFAFFSFISWVFLYLNIQVRAATVKYLLIGIYLFLMTAPWLVSIGERPEDFGITSMLMVLIFLPALTILYCTIVAVFFFAFHVIKKMYTNPTTKIPKNLLGLISLILLSILLAVIKTLRT